MATRVGEPAGRPVGKTGRTRRPSGLAFQVAVLAVAAVATLGFLVGITILAQRPESGPPVAGVSATPRQTAAPTPTPPSYLLADLRPAPELRLTGSDGRPYDLADRRGAGVLVFFGYTHCPDVCPATTGIIGQVLDRYGPGLDALFVTVDPERDTVDWLRQYVAYLPPRFEAATGSAEEIRATADAWGVQYARVDGDSPESYWMNHTASVYLVDREGILRAVFPFGVEPDPMGATVRAVLGEPGLATPPPTATAPAPTPTPAASPTPATPPATSAAANLRVELVSTSVWARGDSPVILALFDDAGRINDPDAVVTAQLTDAAGNPRGTPVPVTAVKPPGVGEVSYVATIDVPTPGWWKVAVTVDRGGVRSTASRSVSVLDPGMTAALGAAAPTIRTPTLQDVGGDATAVTTDPAPDLRLSTTSTADALAARQPFVLVLDSTKFRTSPACGQAIVLARFLLDRWPGVPIIHLEPLAYDVVSDTPVLRGTLSDPIVVPAAAAWGLGPAPWAAGSMPWVFVVDGDGIVRAKYQGIIGSPDIDVILSMLVD